MSVRYSRVSCEEFSKYNFLLNYGNEDESTYKGEKGLVVKNLEVLFPQDILHRNNDRDMLKTFRLCESDFKVENNSSPTRLCKLFELENEEWPSPTQIYHRNSIFTLFESCKGRPILN